VDKKSETTFYLRDDVIEALKIKAVKEKRKYSDVAEELLRKGLDLPKVEVKKKPKVNK
jgi:plasmid stability protein